MPAPTPSPTPTATPTPTPSPTPTATPNATPTDTATPTPTPTTPETPAVVTVAGPALAGRWTAAGWAEAGLNALGYDGLFVRARTANQFTNHIMVDVLPVKVGSDNGTTLAAREGGIYATNLDSDTEITVTLRTGEIKTGVTVAIGLETAVTVGNDSTGSILTISGLPVEVPIAARTSDCTSETGRAAANVVQFQSIVVVQNDTAGFGVDGMSGRMYVGSNGVCELSTPVWNPETRSMSWTVSAPHLAADGVTVNRGFYKAVIPVADARRLWGLTNPADAVTALTVQVTTDAGGSVAALRNIAVLNGNIIIDASGFTYSKKTLRVGVKRGYKPTRATLRTTRCTKTDATLAGARTLTLRGISARGQAPACPTGYRAARR